MVREEITRALRVLICDPADVVEVRVLEAETPGYRKPHIESGFFAKAGIEAVPEAIEQMKYAGVYMTLNPVNPDLLARCANRLQPAKRGLSTTDEDIICRRWLPIDCDPVRPAGISATEAEHDAAQAKAQEIREALRSRGWPDPVVLDSGNGAGLLYRIDLPTEDGGLVARCLAALDSEFSDGTVEIDTAVANPARIWRIPGGWNRKGDDLPERPHRLAAIRDLPEPVEVVTREQLEALAGPVPTAEPRPATRLDAPLRTDRPGDEFNERGDLATLLTRHGWTLLDSDTRNQYWRRPGKDSGNHSATYDGTTFYLFSSAAPPFEANRGYTPFAVYSLLEHGGDFAAASQALAERGFGASDTHRIEYPDVDLSQLLKSLGVRPVGDDPPPQFDMPKELLFAVPGFVSRVMEHTLNTAPYPNETLAFCGAVALQAVIASRRVRDSLDNHPPLYLIALANSGTGKEHPRRVNSDILFRSNSSCGLADAFASGEGLEDSIGRTPALLAQTDEIDALFNAINKSRDGRMESMAQIYLKLYSACRTQYPMRQRASQETSVMISHPSLTLLGTAVPEHFYLSLSGRMLSNGLFARAMVFEAGPRQRGNMRDMTAPPPDDVIRTVELWEERGESGGNLSAVNPEPAVVPDSAEAAKESDEIWTESDRRYNSADNDGERAVWARAFEKTRKLALLWACSENPEAPEITAPGIRWAWEVVQNCTERQLHMAELHIANSQFEGECKRVVQFLESMPGGRASRGQLMRHLGCRAKEMDEIIKALNEQERVCAEIVAGTGGRPRTDYRLGR